jgi:hypothetical protein
MDRITKQELEEFKQIYLTEFGVKLSDIEATKKALNILKGVEMISKFNHRPVSGIDNEK